jgi:DNA/RNA-binding domain of Phe-tRNA-synthetase-like protein
MLIVQPTIDSNIAALAPGFRASSVSVDAGEIVAPEFATESLRLACEVMQRGNAPWAEAHLAAWADVFRRFGAKPQRTPCSAEALRKRVLRDGSLPAIDPIVDLYNAISIQYAIPVGGENFAAYVGMPRLTVAEGTEPFDTVKEGAPAVESPEAGEVIWRDDTGVTCRRWNWRQGVRTRLNSEARQMWFVLESLPEMPRDALHEATEKLCAGLRQMMPTAAIKSTMIGVD